MLFVIYEKKPTVFDYDIFKPTLLNVFSNIVFNKSEKCNVAPYYIFCCAD